ncbi:MAG TPA: gamma-glutamyl-gamma-aminobutyrate hydrolase family protein [candidate division Zixibacteria bacterium]|nr:gamma-glutamyl-gamma-aminobutyrate hydrolase family protein [candidate division Zixibacteria bacterium]
MSSARPGTRRDPKRNILVLQHVSHETLGTFAPLLSRRGFRADRVNFARRPDARPRLDGHLAVVVLGGPMSANDASRLPHIAVELALIEEAMKRGVPLLGVCLGSQLIAKALGAAVYPNPEKEIGWYEVVPEAGARGDPLFGGWAGPQKVFQWHGETFDLPPGTVHLASSSLCRNQAFRYGACTYGLQFHLEVDEPMIRRWLRVPENAREIAALRGKISARAILAETPARAARLRRLGRGVFSEFLRLLPD